MTHNSIISYGDMWIMKEALEAPTGRSRKAVGEAMRKLDTKDGSGKFFPGGGGVMKFDEQGHRVGADIVFVQWQKGEFAVTVYPEAIAAKPPVWSKS